MTRVHTLTPDAVRQLAEALTAADRDGRKVRIADDGGIKFAVGGDMWSLPLAEVVE